MHNKYNKIELLKEECNNMIREGTNTKVVQTYYTNQRKKIDEEIEKTELRLKKLRGRIASTNKK